MTALRRNRLLVAGLAFGLLAHPALAQQSEPPPVTPDDPVAAEPVLPQTCTDEATGETRPCRNLSEQLGETGSVIEPPPVADSDIQVPAPDPTPNTTPVIPPSALPEQQPLDDGTIRQ